MKLEEMMENRPTSRDFQDRVILDHDYDLGTDSRMFRFEFNREDDKSDVITREIIKGINHYTDSKSLFYRRDRGGDIIAQCIDPRTGDHRYSDDVYFCKVIDGQTTDTLMEGALSESRIAGIATESPTNALAIMMELNHFGYRVDVRSRLLDKKDSDNWDIPAPKPLVLDDDAEDDDTGNPERKPSSSPLSQEIEGNVLVGPLDEDV